MMRMKVRGNPKTKVLLNPLGNEGEVGRCKPRVWQNDLRFHNGFVYSDNVLYTLWWVSSFPVFGLLPFMVTCRALPDLR
jgi:hypothetical protein